MAAFQLRKIIDTVLNLFRFKKKKKKEKLKKQFIISCFLSYLFLLLIKCTQIEIFWHF